MPEVAIDCTEPQGETELQSLRKEVESLRNQLSERDNLEKANARINSELSQFFDYFPERILKGFILRTIGIINTAGQGSATSYSITDAPTNWDGVISDLVVAMCMEKLLLDYDLWKGRLIFAMGTDQMLDGYGGDAARQLETIKRNCEERAYKTIDNTQFKAPFAVAAPTKYYYRSLMLGSGPRVSPHGYGDYGKMRGIVINKNVGTGFTGPSY